MTNQSDGLKDSKQAHRSQDLHREFVGMLFALAIAAVAQKVAILAGSSVAQLDLIPAYIHLALATFIITTSWIGWGASVDKFSDKLEVFSKDFIELLLDLWLVVLYFIVVESAEIPAKDQMPPSNGFHPSLQSETFWVSVIFISYFFWDIITKWIGGSWKKYSQRGWASFLCALLSLCVWCFSPENASYSSVIIVDASLIILVLLFRAMKWRNRSDFEKKHVLWFSICAVFILALPLWTKYFNSIQ